MTKMKARDVRLHRPRAEQRLAEGGELVVTCDGKPVARIVPFREPGRRRKRFQSETHLRWLAGFWKGRVRGLVTEEWLGKDRDD